MSRPEPGPAWRCCGKLTALRRLGAAVEPTETPAAPSLLSAPSVPVAVGRVDAHQCFWVCGAMFGERAAERAPICADDLLLALGIP